MKLKVCNQKVTITNHEALVSGSVNIYIAEFEFDSIWDEYSKVAVFVAKTKENEVRREVALSKDACVIPWEVLENTGKLKVGVYGILGDKRLPTIYTDDEIILLGAEASEPFEDPTPGIVEQVVAKTAEDRSAAENAADRAEKAAIRQPYPNEDTGTWWVWNAEAKAYQDTGISYGGSGGGTSDHSKLSNRAAADQHPMSAITGLEEAMEGKQPAGDYLTQEIDPTVPSWAKASTKPSYTATEVGADPSGTAVAQVAAHNTGEAAHSDIRLLIQGLTDRINALADSDDTTLDQLSEIVAYIKSNRDLISSITTSKVSVTDIVDDLVTSVADKPLSAAQGVALKALIDAISVPAATAEDAGKVPVVQADGSYGLGSMIPAPETAEVGQTIVVKAVDEAGKPTEWEAVNLPRSVEYNTVELTEEVSSVEFPLDGADEFSLVLDVPTVQSNMNYVFLLINGMQSSFITANIGSTSSRCMSAFTIKKTTDGIWFLRFKQGNGVNYSANGPASSGGVQILNNMIVADVTSFGIKCYLSQMFPAGTKIYTIKGGAAI